MPYVPRDEKNMNYSLTRNILPLTDYINDENSATKMVSDSELSNDQSLSPSRREKCETDTDPIMPDISSQLKASTSLSTSEIDPAVCVNTAKRKIDNSDESYAGSSGVKSSNRENDYIVKTGKWSIYFKLVLSALFRA